MKKFLVAIYEMMSEENVVKSVFADSPIEAIITAVDDDEIEIPQFKSIEEIIFFYRDSHEIAVSHPIEY